MPNPISSAGPSTCDPGNASCAEFPPATPPAASGTAVVNLEPVLVTGDAGAQALLRSYDASQACGQPRTDLYLACSAIVLGVANILDEGPIGGVASTFHASISCGKELRALADCRDEAQALQSSAAQLVDDCHERGGKVSAGALHNEIVCEVTR